MTYSSVLARTNRYVRYVRIWMHAYTLVIKSVAASAYLISSCSRLSLYCHSHRAKSICSASAGAGAIYIYIWVLNKHIYIYIYPSPRSAGRPRDLASWPSWTRSVGSAIRRAHVQPWGSCARRSLRHEASGGGCYLWRSWCFASTSYWWYFGWRWPASRRSISTPCARSMK